MNYILAAAVSVLGFHGAPEGRMEANLDAIALAYDANRLSVTGGTFDFTYCQIISKNGDYPDKDDLEVVNTAKGFYVFNKNNFRYEIKYNNDFIVSKARKVGNNKIGFSVMSFFMLSDGDKCMLETVFPNSEANGIDKDITIYQDDEFDKKFVFPLNLGRGSSRRFSLSTNIRDANSGREGVRVTDVDGSAELDGVKLVKITFSLKKGTRTYWVDLDRGAVPMKILDVVGDRTIETIYDNIKYINSTAWVPLRETSIRSPSNRGERLTIHEPISTAQPAQSTFRLDLDEPTRVYDTKTGGLYSSRTAWDLSSLPTKHSPQFIPFKPVSPHTADNVPRMTGERDRWASLADWLMPALGMTVLLTIIAIVYIFYNKRNA